MVATIISDEVAVRNIRNLKVQRVKLGLTQALLAINIGVSTTTINAIENGRITCSVLQYNALAKFFGWDVFVPFRKINPAPSVEKEAETIPIDFEQSNNATLKGVPLADVVFTKVETRLTFTEKLKISEFAKNTNDTMSNVIRKAVQAFLAEHSLEIS